MMDFVHIMFWPFLACLVLTGIHAYLGFHVIQRQVIFVDLALAQIAVLGSAVGMLTGFHFDSMANYWFSLLFALIGAGIFALTRFRHEKIPHEAIIGIVYVVAASLMVILLGYSGEGSEHIRQSLIGDVLLVSPSEVIKIAVVYAIVGIIHYVLREKFYLISQDHEQAFKQGVRVRLWDFVFYATFGFVVTSSVKIAGVLLVFSFLVIPSVCAMLMHSDSTRRLLFGWGIGFIGSVLGIVFSYLLDWPTGATIVCTFGLLLVMVGINRFR